MPAIRLPHLLCATKPPVDNGRLAGWLQLPTYRLPPTGVACRGDYRRDDRGGGGYGGSRRDDWRGDDRRGGGGGERDARRDPERRRSRSRSRDRQRSSSRDARDVFRCGACKPSSPCTCLLPLPLPVEQQQQHTLSRTCRLTCVCALPARLPGCRDRAAPVHKNPDKIRETYG